MQEDKICEKIEENKKKRQKDIFTKNPDIRLIPHRVLNDYIKIFKSKYQDRKKIHRELDTIIKD